MERKVVQRDKTTSFAWTFLGGPEGTEVPVWLSERHYVFHDQGFQDCLPRHEFDLRRSERQDRELSLALDVEGTRAGDLSPAPPPV